MWRGARHLSSSAVTGATTKRQLFRSIQPEKGVVEHLDSLQLGFCAKRRVRVAIAKRFGNRTAPNYQKARVPSAAAAAAAAAAKALPPTPARLRLGSPAPPPVPYPLNEVGRPLYQAAHFSELRAKSGLVPEVAIIGRSNVGKSTLVNALLGFNASFTQKALVSAKPGATNQLHFFGMGSMRVMRGEGAREESATAGGADAADAADEDEARRRRQSAPMGKQPPALVVVDMPGYGFAFLNEEHRLRCEDLTFRYLSQRGPALKRVLLLLDARHGFKAGDRDFFQRLVDFRDALPREPATPNAPTRRPKFRWQLQVVLTKCDLVERMELARRVRVVREEVSAALPGVNAALQVVPISGKEGKGLDQLRRELGSIVKREVAL